MQKFAKVCKKYGLTRVQYSIFLGRLDTNRFDKLAEHYLDLMDEDTDSVYLFPFCLILVHELVGEAFVPDWARVVPVSSWVLESCFEVYLK